MKRSIVIVLIVAVIGIAFYLGYHQTKAKKSPQVVSLQHFYPVNAKDTVEPIINGIVSNLTSIQDIRGTIKHFSITYGSKTSSEEIKVSGNATFLQRGINPGQNIRINYDYMDSGINATTGKRGPFKRIKTDVFYRGLFKTYIPENHSLIIEDSNKFGPMIEPISYMGIGWPMLLAQLQARDANGNRNAQLLGWTNYNNDSCLLVLVPWITPKNLFYKIWVVPDKGFVIPCTQIFQVFGTDTVMRNEKKVTFKQTAAGKWVAATGTELDYESILSGDYMKNIKAGGIFHAPQFYLYAKTVIEFGKISFNTNVQDSDFQLQLANKRILVQDKVQNKVYWLTNGTIEKVEVRK